MKQFLSAMQPPQNCKSEKSSRVRKICVRNSGAGNGCANFMDAWKNAFFLLEKPMSIKFLGLGGGILGFGGGGGSADFIFGRADFSEQRKAVSASATKN